MIDKTYQPAEVEGQGCAEGAACPAVASGAVRIIQVVGAVRRGHDGRGLRRAAGLPRRDGEGGDLAIDLVGDRGLDVVGLAIPPLGIDRAHRERADRALAPAAVAVERPSQRRRQLAGRVGRGRAARGHPRRAVAPIALVAARVALVGPHAQARSTSSTSEARTGWPWLLQNRCSRSKS